jgi:hypothetical protein
MLLDEDLRWAVARGSQLGGGQRNRPVLQKRTPNGHTPMTMKEARDDYGFKSVTLQYNSWKSNSTDLEDRLQMKHQHLPLGTRRLWRCLDL